LHIGRGCLLALRWRFRLDWNGGSSATVVDPLTELVAQVRLARELGRWLVGTDTFIATIVVGAEGRSIGAKTRRLPHGLRLEVAVVTCVETNRRHDGVVSLSEEMQEVRVSLP